MSFVQLDQLSDARRQSCRHSNLVNLLPVQDDSDVIEKRSSPPYPEERAGQKLIVKVVRQHSVLAVHLQTYLWLLKYVLTLLYFCKYIKYIYYCKANTASIGEPYFSLKKYYMPAKLETLLRFIQVYAMSEVVKNFHRQLPIIVKD
uniref:Uncharacterized protein n=1 Tax=Heterorhabditis bacteriophora TaxID=37862 RepID=A0A1I7WWH5_HETBA